MWNRTIRLGITLGLALIFNPASSFATLCNEWSQPAQVGNFDTSLLPESSGVVASWFYPDRLYHHNDSGDSLSFYVTDYRGAGTTRVRVTGPHQAIDVEDVGRGPCRYFGKQSCIFLGDIGDNIKERSEVAVVAIEEKPSYGSSVEPLGVFRLRYPDGPHNAEAFAVHPNGDFFIITKEKKRPAQVYHLPVDQLPAPGQIATLHRIGELDLNALMRKPKQELVTGMDIASHGQSFVIITYNTIVEFNFDLATMPLKATDEMREGIDYRTLIDQTSLPQQEAITYMPGNQSILFESEQVGTMLGMSCLR
jgi:hypothetical protein